MGRKLEALNWPGGEHDFALRMQDIKAIQDNCDAGPEYILQALINGSYRQEYLFEVCRHGLIGGGMLAADARKIVYDLADTVGLRELVPTAQTILAAALVGVPDDPLGEAEGEAQNPAFPEASGDLAASTEAEPQ